ncbi:MAG TPA: hypothetical protein VGN49_14640 [Micrococcaceae bacterium]|jgi:hypothetical protein|nr:hypothetical protein [Micrococcaceae bacterium]
MTEQNLPDPDLRVVGEDHAIPDRDADAVSPDVLDTNSAGVMDTESVDGDEVLGDLTDTDVTGTDDQDAQTRAELDSRDAERLDPLEVGLSDDYPGAAENDPDNWRQDPLLQEEPGRVASDEPGVESDQTLRDETEEERYRNGDEQIPPDEPTIGEAAGDLDFGDPMDDEDTDASNDSANFGGSPLSQFKEDELDS